MCKTLQWNSLKAIIDPKDNKIKLIAVRSDGMLYSISRIFNDTEKPIGVISSIADMISLLELERNKQGEKENANSRTKR